MTGIMPRRGKQDALISWVFSSEDSPRLGSAIVPMADSLLLANHYSSTDPHNRNGWSSENSAGGRPSSSLDSALSQCDDGRYELLQKRRGAFGVITGILTCWSKSKEGLSGSFQVQPSSLATVQSKLNETALLEQAKVQEEVLLETQDTSDMWEWHMEQQQVIASQEHELLEHSGTNSSICEDGLPLIGGKFDDEDDDYDAEDALVDWDASPWGWRREEDVVSEKVMQMLEAALLRCRWEVNTFCQVYMQQVVRAGYSLINTLMEMEPNTVFVRRVHASYALEAQINAALFRYFENDSFDDSGVTHIFNPSTRAASRFQEYVRMKGLDPADALRMHSPSYDPAFHNFAAAKSEEVLALLPAGALAFRSVTERDRFMDALLHAAKWAWLLHRLATSSMSPTTILRVARRHPVDPVYVEAVAVPPIGSCARCPVTALPVVEFMIMPGFIAHRKIFRCKVYQHYMCKC